MKICLFGGSFDPIHSAHQEIANALLNDFDEVWLIVANASPFKDKHFATFNQRFEMCNLAFNNDRIKVLDVEYVNNFSYTIETVQYLTSKYDYEFSFAIGADNAKSLEQWKDFETLKTLVDFVVFARSDIPISIKQITFENTISSSRVRITKDSEIQSVNDYIKMNNLYVSKYENDFDNLMGAVNLKRFNHSVNVFNLINKLAKTHDLDVHKCSLAAIYHDYYKNYATTEVISEFKKQYPQYINYPNAVMHGVIVSYELGNFNIFESDIVEAVRFHPIGLDNASVVLKALYIADYCEEGRKFRSEVVSILELAFTNLDAAYKKALKERNRWIIDNLGMHEDIYNLIKNTMEE